MAQHKSPVGRQFFKIQIEPVFNDVEFKYRVIVLDVSTGELGEEVAEIRDILHYDTLLDATMNIASRVGKADGYVEFTAQE